MRDTRDQVEVSRERFVHETREHDVKIVRDDGLYRHVRCQAPGTWIYGFDVVTWPGYLAIVGDAGDFVFSRIRDMFEFFAGERSHDYVNPDYWIQKLQAPRPDGARVYSERALWSHLREWASYEAEYGGTYGEEWFYARDLLEALERELRYRDLYHEQDARQALRDVEDEVGEQVFGEAWEWDLRDYDWQFLWCCHAIVFAIKGYRQIKGPEAQAA